MRIGLIVDHPKRDLEGLVHLAYELVKRGAEALLVPMYAQGPDVPLLGLDAVVANYARPANGALLARYKDVGINVFVLDTEGGVLAERGANSPFALARVIRDGGYRELLAGYFFWGSRLRDAFAREGSLPSHGLHLTGCPRFDFAAPRFRALLDRNKRGYVLINTNFPLVNPRFSASSGRECASMIAAGWEPAYVDRLIEALREIFPRYCAILRSLAAARPGLQFLVRPHPFERVQPYEDAFHGLSNARVDGSGSALQAIHNSAAVLHLNCGTAVEAVMLGKLPVQLELLNTPAVASHARLPARVSYSVACMDELLAVLDDIPAATARFPFAAIYREHVWAFFHENDGLAGARVAETLVRELRHTGSRRHKRSYAAALTSSRTRPSMGQVASGVASLALGSAMAGAVRMWLRPERRDKLFSATQVQSILAQLAAHDDDGARAIRAGRSQAGPLHLPLASVAVKAA